MTDFETPNHNPYVLYYDLVIKMESRKGLVLLDIAVFLQQGGLEDELDKRLVREAVEFIENPTRDIETIMKHTKAMSAVDAEYDMQRIDSPAAIEALYEYIYDLQCITQIKFAEKVFKREPFDFAATKAAIHQASLSAKMLIRGWKDNTFLNVVDEFRAKLESL